MREFLHVVHNMCTHKIEADITKNEEKEAHIAKNNKNHRFLLKIGNNKGILPIFIHNLLHDITSVFKNSYKHTVCKHKHSF